MRIEKEGAIDKLQNIFMNGLIKLLEYMTNYYKFASPDLSPPFTNTEGAEVPLQKYFHNADNKIYEYLKTSKKNFIEDKIKPRIKIITYTSDANITDEQFETANKFKELVCDIIKPTIEKITITLLK